MACKDLREWLNVLEQEGELARVKTMVDWDLEIGGIAQEVFDREGPALLFENIKDYQDTICRRFFTASLSTYPRIALALGLPKNTPYPEIIKVVMERIQHPVKPVLVDSGPVKENIVTGDDVDLFQFPAPKWHKLDGGRYIGTFDGVVTRDPDTGWVNIGCYRRMVHDRNHTGITVIQGQHIWRQWQKYRERGIPMPVAFFNGWDPVGTFTSTFSVPEEVCEYDIMGALRQAPVELVRCETVDLEVPATAEIVMEGEICTDFGEFRTEGPFGEYTGYYTSEPNKKPVLTVKCITHRNHPILQGTMEGVPINEDHRVCSIHHSAIVWEHLKRNMMGVTGVNVDPSTGWANVIVQINNRYIGQAQQVAANIWGMMKSTVVGKNIIVVDEDIDIYDLRKVMWAIAYRVDPARDISVFPGSISPTDPVVHPENRQGVTLYRGNRMLIDATKPIENKRSPLWFNEKFAPVCYPDPDTVKLVRQKWPEYGINA